MTAVNSRLIGDIRFFANQSGQWAAVPESASCDLDANGEDWPIIVRSALERNLVVRTKNNHSDFENAIKRWNSLDYVNPTLFIVHLTQRCNLTCGFCHSSAVGVDAQGKDLSYKNLESIARFIVKSPGKEKNINFQGGEPTLCIDLIDEFVGTFFSFSETKDMKVSFSLTSNGTLIDEKAAEFLRKRKVSVSLSIDGPKELHDRERRFEDGRGSYDITSKTKSRLRREYPEIYSGQIMVVTPSSKDRYKDIIRELSESGQDEFRFKFVTTLGRGKKYVRDHGKTNAQEFVGLYTKVIQEIKRLKAKEGIVLFETYMMTFLGKLFLRINGGDIDTRNQCGIAKGVVDFNIRGEIHACHETNKYKFFKLGHAADTFDKVFRSPEAERMRSYTDLLRHGGCRSCAYFNYCTPCPATNFQESGSPEVKPGESYECLKTLGLIDFIISDMQDDMVYYTDLWKRYILKRLAG